MPQASLASQGPKQNILAAKKLGSFMWKGGTPPSRDVVGAMQDALKQAGNYSTSRSASSPDKSSLPGNDAHRKSPASPFVLIVTLPASVPECRSSRAALPRSGRRPGCSTRRGPGGLRSRNPAGTRKSPELCDPRITLAGMPFCQLCSP